MNGAQIATFFLATIFLIISVTIGYLSILKSKRLLNESQISQDESVKIALKKAAYKAKIPAYYISLMWIVFATLIAYMFWKNG